MPTCDNSVENLHRLHPGQPLRLQHSPSLPNLCTAPYVKATSQSSRPRHYSRCSTPPPEKSFDFNIPTSPTTTPTTPTQNIKPLSHFGIITPSKIRTHPITPPRTPSASLNGETVSNGDSASDNDDTVIESGSEAGNEPVPPSRFLLIENIDRAVSTPALKESLFSSFTSIPRTSSIVGTRSDNSRKSNNNPIKGIYVRLVPSDGIVVLAFYDLRDAANAMMRIQNGDIVSMAGDRKEANVRREPSQDRQECQPERPELNCRFIMPRDLEKLIGHSTFVTETEGGFLVSSSDELSNTKAEDDGSGVNRKRVLAPESLKTMLGSFGPLCQFECTKKAVGDRKDVDVSTEPEVFWAEYFDVRNTAAARTALNGRTIFGVKLRLFARDGQHDVHDGGSHAFQHDAGPEDETIQVLGSIPFSHSPSTPTGTSYIPFPSSPVSQVYHALDEHHTTRDHVRVAGSQRILFFDKAGRARPRSASAGHDSSSPTDLSSPTLIDPSSSPIILDSSFPFSLPALHSSPPSSPSVSSAPQTVELHGRRCSNHLFFDATGKQTQGDSTRPRSLNVNIPVDDHAIRAADEQEAEQTPTSSFVYSNMNQHHTPYYYSTSPQESMPYYHSSYYHTPTPVPQSALQFPLPPSSPTSYGYNQEALNLNSWLWAPPPPPIPGMAALGTTSAYYQGVPPAPSPHMGGVYYPHLHPQYQQISFPGEAQTTMSAPDPAAYLQTDQMSYQPHYAAFGLASPAQHTHQLPSAPLHEPPSAPSHPGLRTSAHLPSTGGPPSPPVVNHLNLTKIEEGLDTRTTVMVKNIPNKMSDKDLIAYIGNVCPKKIDFLYLRMDFQNGCNVGYAFVNFIRVEDLLTFAKSKLGVKWNMFSSEKVLQMSYANYQGKEALVEKFKNSCIMDEREAWRPKVFCSEPGINQGKPEPFPSPTHIRRKERSSLNRGALFVPGINAGGSHHLHNVPNRDQRTQPNDKEAAENNPSGQSYIGTQPPHSGTSTTFRSKKSSQQHLGRSPT